MGVVGHNLYFINSLIKAAISPFSLVACLWPNGISFDGETITGNFTDKGFTQCPAIGSNCTVQKALVPDRGYKSAACLLQDMNFHTYNQ